jgi:hypothetical protein
LRPDLNDWLIEAARHVRFHYDAGGIVCVLTNQDDNHVTLVYGVPRFSFPIFVGIRFMERTVANPMIGFVFGLSVKVILKVFVLVELKTHEDIESGHRFTSVGLACNRLFIQQSPPAAHPLPAPMPVYQPVSPPADAGPGVCRSGG